MFFSATFTQKRRTMPEASSVWTPRYWGTSSITSPRARKISSSRVGSCASSFSRSVS